MPTGIILSSGSQGATQEAIEKVLTENGYEAEKPETQAAAEIVEPKRDAFASDDEFEQAQEEFATKQEELEEQRYEEEETKRLATLPKKTRRQKAIEKATRDLQTQLRQANDRLAALEGKGSGNDKGKPAAAQAEELKAPKREDFKTDSEYEDALFDHRYKLRRAKEASENAQKQLQQRLEKNFTDYQTSVADFKEEHDDWDEVVNNKLPIHESVYLTIPELENGPAVTYYLGKHPAYAQKLAEMSPLAAVVEVGRLSDRLKTGAPNRGEADEAAKPKPKSKLPAPVTPVGTSATSSTQTSRDAAKARDFKAFKAAQRRGA